MPGPEPLERHFTVAEISELWKMSDDVVRREFKDEPGVLKFGGPSRLSGRKYKRHYHILRIPESVFRRVQDRLMHKRSAAPSVPLERGTRRDLHAG